MIGAAVGAPCWSGLRVDHTRYDGFGNLLTVTPSGGGPSPMNVTVDAANNRVNGWSYDANGNVTAMPGGISGGVYDIENRLVEASRNAAVKYGYGADNRRVFESKRVAVNSGGDTIEEVVTWWSGQQRIGRYKIRWNDQAPNNGAPNSFVFARMEEENVYFGSRPLKLGAETNVWVDRLGSVRRSGRDYFPYGQEAPSTTTGGKEKYGTYRHDGETDLSYADQRYYATGAGRFMTADPYRASAGVGDPGSWNRYAYTRGDPVGRFDPRGLEDDDPSELPAWEWCAALDRMVPRGQCPSNGVPPFVTPPTQEEQIAYAQAVRKEDTNTNRAARGKLSDRLKDFETSNCNRVFGARLSNYSAGNLRKAAESTLYYDVRNAEYAGLTQNQTVGNGSQALLGQSLPYGQSAQTINGTIGSAVLLPADWANQSDAADRLVHELLHTSAMGGLSDPQIFARFRNDGLDDLDYRAGFGTSAITNWIARDCKAGPK